MALRPGAISTGSPARQESLRRHNLSLILGELAGAGALTRAELSRRVGLTKASVSNMVDVLIGAGTLSELAPAVQSPTGRGRPGAPVGFAPWGPVAIGLEVGVDYLSACTLDLSGAVCARDFLAADNRQGGPAGRLAEMAALARRMADKVRRQGSRVVGAGLAVPGVVGPTGRLWSAPNLPHWAGVQPAAMLEDRLGHGLPVLEVGNEANLAALGELWYGRRRELRDFVLVSGEIGVGAGVVVGGRLFSGSSGGAGELGHVTVEIDGPHCGCGSRGCLEQYVGQEAILRSAGAANYEELLGAAGREEPRARAALAAAGRALGVATSALLNVVDVPAVVLGGIYAGLAPYLMAPLVGELHARVISHSWAPVEVLVASLGAEAAMRGAAGAVLQKVLADPAAFIPGLLDGGTGQPRVSAP